MSATFIRFPKWHWWLVFWPPGLKRYIDDTAKFYAARIELDQHATVEQWGDITRLPG